MKTLVTGANGFIGSAVVKNLLEKGFEVRSMVRESSDISNLQSLDTEICRADLCDKNSLEKSVQGCESIFHVAADYRLWIPDPDNMYKANVDGTRNLLLAAEKAAVNKIVYTSSVAALGLSLNGEPANEETPTSLDNMIGHYKRSKYLAEQEVFKLIASHNIPVAIVNPSTPIGPGDIKPTPTGRIVKDAMNGAIPAYVDTGLNIVHVNDVAEGHFLAYEKGKIGERYILGGENLTLQSLLTEIANLTGQKPPKIKLPHSLVLPVAYIMEFIANFTGNEPQATVDAVRMSKTKMYFSSDKAKSELDYKPGPSREAIKDAVNWFRQQTE